MQAHQVYLAVVRRHELEQIIKEMPADEAEALEGQLR